tara:strand:- start:16527 stop:16757 length:231 start_codon:yes stop_codon:yes gene_type:complete
MPASLPVAPDCMGRVRTGSGQPPPANTGFSCPIFRVTLELAILVLPDGHRLKNSIGRVVREFRQFLKTCLSDTNKL